MRVLLVTTLVIGALAWTQPATLLAQEQRASPHETVEGSVDGAKITITYGRPYVKGRQIFGGLVPFGKIWRTGADEATTLVTDKPLSFGSIMVPAGTYTLYTLPTLTEWRLVINKQTGQWGTEYQQAQDLGRVPAQPAKNSAPIEQLTLSVEDTPAGGALKLEWADTVVSFPFTVGK